MEAGVRMLGISDLKKTKEELLLALVELDRIEETAHSIDLGSRNGSQDKDAEEMSRKKIEDTKNANKELKLRNKELLDQFHRVNAEKATLMIDVEKLQKLSQTLQIDIGKVNEEKIRLSSIVKNTQDENNVLSQVLEKISIDYEELKKAFESQKCPKDDKIKALRNTARALETENELLLEEKRIIQRENLNIRNALEQKVAALEQSSQLQKEQLAAYFNEKKDLLDRFTDLEGEKSSIFQQLMKVENELDTNKLHLDKVLKEKDKIVEEKNGVDESLIALKDCKRVVELRYKSILTEKSELSNKVESLTQQTELLQVKNQSLEERMVQLENEKAEQTDILSQLQDNLIKKTSEHETQVRSMQIELEKRLDEVDFIQKEDANKVKGHYIQLFDEKASEVMSLRSELDKCNILIEDYKRKCKDLEYREEELNDLVNKMRADPSIVEEDETRMKLEASLSKTILLQEKLDSIRHGFEEMKVREKVRVSQFEVSIEKLNSVICNKDRIISELTVIHTKDSPLSVTDESHNKNGFENAREVSEPEEEVVYEDGQRKLTEDKRKVKKKKKKKRNS